LTVTFNAFNAFKRCPEVVKEVVKRKLSFREFELAP
jgi:hypothetical protein